NRPDAAVRVVRADDAHVQLVREGNVASEAAAAADQRSVFEALDRPADPGVAVLAHPWLRRFDFDQWGRIQLSYSSWPGLSRPCRLRWHDLAKIIRITGTSPSPVMTTWKTCATVMPCKRMPAGGRECASSSPQ